LNHGSNSSCDPETGTGPGEVLGFHIGRELIAGRGVGQIPHLLGDADPPLRPVVVGLALVFNCRMGRRSAIATDTIRWF